MSTAIFKNINLVDTLPELRLTATGSDYMRQYRSATANGGYQYNRVATGITGTMVEAIIWSSKDGVLANEKGIQTFGDTAGRTVLDGLTTRFNVGGVEKGQLNSTAFNYSLPNIITGSSDTTQFKILANSTQTSNILDVFSSDGVTRRFGIGGNGITTISATAAVGSTLGIVQVSDTGINNENTGLSFLTTNAAQNSFFTMIAPTSGAGRPSLVLSNTSANFAAGNSAILSLERTTSKILNGTANDLLLYNNFDGRDILFGTKNTTLSEKMRITSAGNVGIGTTAPSAKLHSLSTTEQLRLGYNASNYLSATVASNNTVTLANAVAADININCGTDKTVVLTETVWDDLAPSPIIAAKLGSTAPTLATFISDVEQYTFDASNDYVIGATEITHKWKEGTTIYPHIHWATNGTNADDRGVQWQLKYTIGDAVEVFSVQGTTVVDVTIPLATADRTHFISEFATPITGTNYRVGAYICWRLDRIATAHANGAPADDPFGIAVGFHVEMDTIGSRTKTAK